MTVNVVDFVERLKMRGFNLHLVDGVVKVVGPKKPDSETQGLLNELRKCKGEVTRLLSEDDPILPPTTWFPEFHRLHVRIVQETPNLDWQWLKEQRPDLYRAIKDRENKLDALGDARLSEIMAIMREWRGLVLKAEFKQKEF